MHRSSYLSQVVVLVGCALSALAATAVNSPLADSAEKSDRAAIRTLLKQRADVNAPQAIRAQCVVRLSNIRENQ